MVNFEKELTYGRVAIQGNLNPKILLESRNIIKDETYKILSKYKDYPGYIFNLGHGITPDINPDNVKYLTDIVREFSDPQRLLGPVGGKEGFILRG